MQTAGPTRLKLPLVAALGALAVAAASPLAAQSLSTSASISASETLRHRTGTGDTSDAVTDITPSVSMSSRSGMVQGSLSYSATASFHSNDTDANTLRHALSANGNAQLVPQRLGVNASASVSQQLKSVFGTQTVDPLASNDNQAQVASYSLSPYLQGRLLGEVSYNARLTYTGSHTSSSDVGDTSTLSGSAGLSGRSGKLGWALNASQTRADNQSSTGNAPQRTTGSYVLSLTYQPDIEWTVSARVGGELNSLRTGTADERSTTWGGGVQWLPGPRTSVNLQFDERFFGRSHSVSFSHRMARTVWTVSDSRSLSLGGPTGGILVSLYDLYFVQLASIEPDEVRRDALVRAFLAANGLSPTATTVLGGFVTSSASVQRSQLASMAYQGLRWTLSVSLSQSRSSRFGLDVSPGDDLSQAGAIRQRGLTVSFSHRLTPTSSLSLTGALQSTPDAGTVAGNDLRSITASWTAQLGNRTSASLSARYAQFSSETSPYHESSLIGTLSMRF